MEDAGAVIIERTCDDGTMCGGSFAKVAEHLGINHRIKRWLKNNRIGLHVPVDSPAANFPICKITHSFGCKIVHLVAPQFWAWGPWRIKKLRKFTDLVLCLLPFEEEYFNNRGVRAKFIGHPSMNMDKDCLEGLKTVSTSHLPQGAPKIVFLPGSRSGEVRKHTKAIINIFSELKQINSGACGVIIAASDDLAELIHKIAPALPVNLFVLQKRLHAALDWANLAITCSGTATLDVASHHLPMVVMYKMNPIPWYFVGKWLITTPYRALPNLIADDLIVPEFIPYCWTTQPIIKTSAKLLEDSNRLAAQRAALQKITALYENLNPAVLAVDAITEILNNK